MTGVLWLDWAILAMSLFNTVLQLWLGLTVLLNAERRSWGIWLSAGGLLLGSVFFLSHSVILGFGPREFSLGINIWWRIGWLPVLFLPYAWYLVILWYGGYWEDRGSSMHRRQRPWFTGMSALLILLVGLLLYANPLPSLTRLMALDLNDTLSLSGIPVLVLAYPCFILLCIGLALNALRQPGPTDRWSGVQARLRARPWLVSVSYVLMAVGLLVGWIMLWIVRNAQQGAFTQPMTELIGLFDGLIAGLIAFAVILLGQALVAYELFTGKSLPRRGLLRYWRWAIVLAAGYGLFVAGSQAAGLPPIYGLLLSTVLMTVFFALLIWRAYAEQDRLIASLRPFIASPRLYERLTGPAETSNVEDGSPWTSVDLLVPFRALCADVLGAQSGTLMALGALAPFSGKPLVYPGASDAGQPLQGAELAERFTSPQSPVLHLDGTRYGGAVWAVPLWGERGLTGLFMLGPKQDGGLYTQEEIEIARLAGERLIDAQASSEMAGRLMRLQRQRLAQSQVIDQQTRRILHDEVLPQLHSAVLALTGPELVEYASIQETLGQLTEVHRNISNLLRAIPSGLPRILARLGFEGAIRNELETELADAFDAVSLELQPSALEAIQRLPGFMQEVLYYAAREALRNAANHARVSSRPRDLNVCVRLRLKNGLELEVEDNGGGIRTADERDSGANRGAEQGLALHSTMMAVIGGSLALESELGRYTRIRLWLPITAGM